MAVTLAVNEIFGPTVQGEGPSIGQPAAFLRMAACNLACVWCDTRYAWDWKSFDPKVEVHRYKPQEAARLVKGHLPPTDPPLLVVSGGEPMLQQQALTLLMDELPALRLEIETAGTCAPTRDLNYWVTQYNVSVKLGHSGNPLEKRLVPRALEVLNMTGKVVWKFVCQTDADVREAAALVGEFGLAGPVYVMPEGTDPEILAQRAAALVPAVIEQGWTLTPRLHIELWGPSRGH